MASGFPLWNSHHFCSASSFEQSSHGTWQCLHQDLLQWLHKWIECATSPQLQALSIPISALVCWHPGLKGDLAYLPIPRLGYARSQEFCKFSTALVLLLLNVLLYKSQQQKWSHLCILCKTSIKGEAFPDLQHPRQDRRFHEILSRRKRVKI